MSMTWHFPSLRGHWNTSWAHNDSAYPRHPVCAAMNALTVMLIAVNWWRMSPTLSLGQHAYFALLFTLFVCSTSYHTLPKARHPWARYFDQVAIGWYICGTCLPFVSDHLLATGLLVTIMLGFAWLKWLEQTGALHRHMSEKWYKRTISLVFLGAGVCSLGLCALYDTSGVMQRSSFWIAILLFLTKLLVWHKSKEVPGKAVNCDELCHTILLVPVVLFTGLVLEYG